MEPIVEQLLASPEPSVKYKVMVNVMGVAKGSPAIWKLQQEIKASSRVKRLLSVREKSGKIPLHPYSKWRGAHWTLSILADIGYPKGDTELIPMREQVLGWLLGTSHKKGIKTIEGKTRRCASQESNAVYSLLTLGLADERADELVTHLISWQWPDGGWNCDKRPEACNSSYHESWIPFRALALYASIKNHKPALQSVKRAAELFLKRNLYKRLSDGSVIAEGMARLHYPPYWHYELLGALKVMAEAGYISDPRCPDALDLLESKRLPDGGFPAEAKYYRPFKDEKRSSGTSLVDWGPTGMRKMNPWVTADALYILKAADRL